MPSLLKITIFLFLCNVFSYEVDYFLHADRHESFIEFDTMIFDGMVKHS